VYSYLCTRLLHSDFSAEIYPDLVGWLASLGEVLGSDDSADSDLYRFEIGPGDNVHRVSIGKYQKNQNILSLVFSPRQLLSKSAHKKSTPDRVDFS
jgi:hypothetical protein